MVYCGKPSKGCQTCRERKIRCDQLPEGCGQCAKQNWMCPGYRAQLDLMFRNESQNVVRKAKAREAKAKYGSSSNGSTPSIIRPTEDSGRSTPEATENDLSLDSVSDRRFPTFSPPALTMAASLSTKAYTNLAPTVEERATNYFVSNYVIGVSGPTRGHLDVMNTMYSFDDSLKASMKAVGLAGFANQENSAAVMKEARKEYSTALRLTNVALRSTEEAKRDSTLLTIMILSIYETVTGNNQRSLKSWAEHIRGAAALVKLRGLEQLKTPEGRRLVNQVTSNLLIACIQRELPLPDHILEMREVIKQMVDLNEPAWQIQETMVQFCNFRAMSRNKSTIDPRWILARALELDGQLFAMFLNLPLGWRYETRYAQLDPDLVWKECYHVYYDDWIAQIWNAMRTCRMMLNEEIRDTLLRGFSATPPVFSTLEHTAQFQLSTDTLFQLQADILASVPQHIGLAQTQPVASLSKPEAVPHPLKFEHSSVGPISRAITKGMKTPIINVAKEDMDMPSPENRSPLPVLRATGGYFLLWPLFVAAVIDVASEESRTWVVGRLRHIAGFMGIRQAYVLAEVLEKKVRVRPWMKDQESTADMRQGPYMDAPEVELNDEDME